MSGNSNNPNAPNKRMRFTRQVVITNTFLQMPRFLTAGEFAGNKLSNNARVLYTLLFDRHRISLLNEWFDENGEVYIYFKREEMESQLGLSERTVSKVMQELKDLFLVEEKKQGMNRPNKIYLLSPIIGNDENPTPYLEPSPDYNPEIGADSDYATEPKIVTPPETQNLRPPTRNNYAPEPAENTTSRPVNSTPPNPQDLRPNNNKLTNNQKIDNQMSDNEGRETATACGGAVGNSGNTPTPCSRIFDMYNELSQARGLRSIKSISGKRKTQTNARLKEYGIDGFVELFNKVADSVFLCGGGERGWKVDFDWLIDPANMQKVLEGKYDNDQSNTPLPPQPQIYEQNVLYNQHSPQTARPSPLPDDTGQGIFYAPTSDGVVIEPVVRPNQYPNYRNKNGFNTMAALQQMLDAEEAHEANQGQ